MFPLDVKIERPTKEGLLFKVKISIGNTTARVARVVEMLRIGYALQRDNQVTNRSGVSKLSSLHAAGAQNKFQSSSANDTFHNKCQSDVLAETIILRGFTISSVD